MQISCALAPGLTTPEHAVLAEELGYERVWLYDSPALYGDVWIGLARIAERTSGIGLGTGVAVPSLQHLPRELRAFARAAGVPRRAPRKDPAP
jgi:5,10-methylenetetrahydromethanopterin reductase